ncbi:hypothetical protein ONS96_014515 [Cadophora gregata f. sp. sojae]|nr:hypothetical protein ONS96_014515 [Cadophora gregata f. sp. sojae]
MKNPVEDHNYLAEELDILALSEACKCANEIITQGKGTRAIGDGSWPTESTYHENTEREELDTIPEGKCNDTMGTSNDTVLDAAFHVRGVNGLRVADISVMPLLNQHHIQIPAYTIGRA